MQTFLREIIAHKTDKFYVDKRSSSRAFREMEEQTNKYINTSLYSIRLIRCMHYASEITEHG